MAAELSVVPYCHATERDPGFGNARYVSHAKHQYVSRNTLAGCRLADATSATHIRTRCAKLSIIPTPNMSTSGLILLSEDQYLHSFALI